MSQDIQQSASETPSRSIYDDLNIELHEIDSDMSYQHWTLAIQGLERVSTTLSQLPVDGRRDDVLENLRTLMSDCIRDAPPRFLAEMSDNAWAICPDQPILERRFDDEKEKHYKVCVVPFSVAGSHLDPLCLCRPRAQDHWCDTCAFDPYAADPTKYTVGGLLAHKASR